MITIVDKNTGKVLYSSAVEVDLKENELSFEGGVNGDFVIPYRNLETGAYYEGATEEEIAEANAPEVPFEVPLWAMRTVLKQSDLFQLVLNVIETLEEPTRTVALDFLEYGNFVERQSNTVVLIQSITQMTDAQVDQLFIEAGSLKL